jgi:hypothetical protein
MACLLLSFARSEVEYRTLWGSDCGDLRFPYATERPMYQKETLKRDEPGLNATSILMRGWGEIGNKHMR